MNVGIKGQKKRMKKEKQRNRKRKEKGLERHKGEEYRAPLCLSVTKRGE